MPLALKSLDDGGAEHWIEGDKAFSIGRGADNDLVIVDPSREVSKTHCRIEPDGNKFVLTDLSINGVTVEGQAAPMGPGAQYALASGDVFVVGPRRFGVVITDSDHVAGAAASESVAGDHAAPKPIHQILEGFSEGQESRASAGTTGEAHNWLNTVPTGTAAKTLHEPLGWEGPPSTEPSILPPDFDHPASDFANRSEHAETPSYAFRLPQANQVIPTDWLDDESAAAPPSNVAPAPDEAKQLVKALVEAARLDPASLAGVGTAELMQRCGAALRAFTDALDNVEAAQAVLERDCGLPPRSYGTLWADFFANNRDPLLALLAEPHPGPSELLGNRASALADRQRALGHAVAAAAQHYDAVLSPAPIAAETVGRFRPARFAKASSWNRFSDLHAELVAGAEVEGTPTFLIMLRKTFEKIATN